MDCCDRGLRIANGQKRFCECAGDQQLRESFYRTFSVTPNPALTADGSPSSPYSARHETRRHLR